MLRMQTDEPLEYAARWSEPHHPGDPDGFERTVRRWLAYYDELGVGRITGAMVMLRRRADGRAGHRRAVSLAKVPYEPTGDAYARLFEAQDRLAQLDGGDAPLRPARGLTVERRARPGGEAKCVLDCPAALGMRRPVAPALADAVEQPDLRATADLRDLVKLGYVVFDDAAG
jgi:hypothetical protein